MLHIESQRRELTRNPRLLDTKHRARATYLFWFRMPLRDDTLTPCLHPYLCAGARMPAAWVESMARLRLSSHALRVELGRHARPRVAFQDRKCTRCTAGDSVDDEYHLLLECGATEAVRRTFADIIPVGGTQQERMHALMRGPHQPASVTATTAATTSTTATTTATTATTTATTTSTTTATSTTTTNNNNSLVRRRAQFVHECLAAVPVTRA